MREPTLQERRPIVVKNVSWPLGAGEPRFFDVLLTPLNSQRRLLMGVLISFTDVTCARPMHEQLERSKQELETTQEELR